MFFNNVHIGFYILIAAIGGLLGPLVAWMTKRFAERRPVFSKDFKKIFKTGIKYSYTYAAMIAVLYVLLLYKYGFGNSFNKNLDLIKYLILTPLLISAFFVDLKERIIPNRLTLTIFEIGIAFTFLYGINNINVAQDMLLGMLVGAGIFGGITLLGGLLAGKEAMGMGDVKLVGALGLFYGVTGVTALSISSFFMGALVAIIILIIRTIQKSEDKYVAFGPFIVASAILMMFISPNTVFSLFMGLCIGLSNGIMNIFR